MGVAYPTVMFPVILMKTSVTFSVGAHQVILHGARKAFTPEARQVHKQRKTSPSLPLSLEQQVTSQKTSLPLARDQEAGEENMDRAHSRQLGQFEERDGIQNREGGRGEGEI